MGMVIVFVTVMAVVVTALMMSSGAALRSAMVLPQADGDFFSAEAAINRALPMVVSSLAEIENRENCDVIEGIVLELAAETMRLIGNSPLSLDNTDDVPGIRDLLNRNFELESLVAQLIERLFEDGGIRIPNRTPFVDAAPRNSFESGSEHFYLTYVGAAGPDFGEPAPQFATPAFVGLRRNAAGQLDVEATVRLAQRPSDGRSVFNIDVRIPFTSEAGAAQVSNPGFVLELPPFFIGGMVQGINNSAPYGPRCNDDGDGAGTDVDPPADMLENVPFYFRDTDDWPDGSVNYRDAAYRLLRDGIRQIYAAGRPTRAQLFTSDGAYPFTSPMNANTTAYFCGENNVWVPISGYLRNFFANNTVDGKLDERIRYINAHDEWDLWNTGINYDLIAPGLRAIHVNTNVRIRPGVTIEGHSDGLMFTMHNPSQADLGSLTVETANNSETTINNVVFHSSTINIGSQNARDASLFGDSVYISHSGSDTMGIHELKIQGIGLTIGAPELAPQFYTRAGFSPENASAVHFHGIMGADSAQFFPNRFTDWTITGIAVVNLYEDGARIYQNTNWGQDTVPGLKEDSSGFPTNSYTVRSSARANVAMIPADVTLTSGALNGWSPVVQNINRYAAGSDDGQEFHVPTMVVDGRMGFGR